MSIQFTINSEGWLSPAKHVLSPNYNERPDGTEISLLVIHNISLPPDQFGGSWVEDFFLNRLDPKAHPFFETICNMKVSSHLFIRRDGEVIQFVPFLRRAWHAGDSCFGGIKNCNDYSIGIEVEGSDLQPYTDEQYQVLAAVTRAIQKQYPITLERITGHSDIAPERKTDPGPYFNWDHFRQLLQA